jgi:CubicO group peptidase (beta-lactamase class C family)
MRAAFTLACCAAFACTGGTSASGLDAGIDPQALTCMQTAHVPGMAVVVVRHDQVVLSRGYGTADLSTGAPVTTDTVFGVASISKTVTATALMQLVETGALGLDDDVDTGLGFAARNPAFPNAALTPRMLLSHTAGIHDTPILYGSVVKGMDSPIPLRTFIRGYLVPLGAYYRAANWSSTRPGTAYEYSNASVDLAGELVEQLAGTDLQTWSQQRVFAPLQMNESSWFLSGLELNHLAMPYTLDSAGQPVASGQACYPDYPNGQLRTSAGQLARFLMMVIGGGTLDGARVLQASSVTEMLAQQPSSLEGLSWQRFSFGGHAVLGHSGVDTGISTDLWFDPDTGAGFVLLTNSNVFLDHFGQFENGNYGPELKCIVDLETALLELAEP